MACRLATWPTRRSPLLENPTTEGVVRAPSSFGMTLGSPPSSTATHEFVVPRSIPMIFAIVCFSCLKYKVFSVSLDKMHYESFSVNFHRHYSYKSCFQFS